MSHRLLNGDVVANSVEFPDQYFDAVLCDPPYHLAPMSKPLGAASVSGFMGHTWDGGDIAFRPETWSAIMRTMKPGAYLMAFGGARTSHRMAVAMEDAGLILVDTLMWLYFSGFPKSINVAAHIDKKMGGSGQRTGAPKQNTHDKAKRDAHKHMSPADLSNTGGWGLSQSPHGLPTVALETDLGRAWDGYGTALKPAYEPIILCRKPFLKEYNSYADNAIRFGCGALNIDHCRIPVENESLSGGSGLTLSHVRDGKSAPDTNGYHPADAGRWPANVILDEQTADLLDSQSRNASRFLYVSKVSPKERNAGLQPKENDHPTLKPIDLTKQLATLLLPPQIHNTDPRRIMVPFSGAGSEMIGALKAGWDEVVGIEKTQEYLTLTEKRIAWWLKNDL